MKPVLCLLKVEDGQAKFIEVNKPQNQSEWSRPWKKSTLTYSVIRGTEDLPGNSKEMYALSIALQTWETEVSLKFVRVKSTENPDIRLFFKPASEDEHFTGTVLAYAYLPSQGSLSGIVVVNDDYNWSLNGKPSNGKPTYNLIHTLIHELGHTLGLLHDEHNDTADVMDPYYNKDKIDLSNWDIIRIRTQYPIRVFSRWNMYQRIKDWLAYRKRRL